MKCPVMSIDCTCDDQCALVARHAGPAPDDPRAPAAMAATARGVIEGSLHALCSGHGLDRVSAIQILLSGYFSHLTALDPVAASALITETLAAAQDEEVDAETEIAALATLRRAASLRRASDLN